MAAIAIRPPDTDETQRTALATWTEVVRAQFPNLTQPQATVLAEYSFGMVVAQTCGRTSIAHVIAALGHEQPKTVEQRLREWCCEAEDKSGTHRQALDVSTCFGPLLAWVLSLWPPDHRRLALALDASTLGKRFVALVISVVLNGCAIPIAWKIIPAEERGAWQPHWEALLSDLRDRVPDDWTVIVLADRGLYARWLFTAIVALRWHPFLRINAQGQVRPTGESAFRALSSLLPEPGGTWQGAVTCFKSAEAQLDATLVARWDAGHADPWLILTDLPPDEAQAVWYQMRAWIEAGFKDTKRGGWHWEQTKMTDGRRAERLWLAIAVATLWAIAVGSEADAEHTAADLDILPAPIVGVKGTRRAGRPRLLSAFRTGVLLILVNLIAGLLLLPTRLVPRPWPTSPAPPFLAPTTLREAA